MPLLTSLVTTSFVLQETVNLLVTVLSTLPLTDVATSSQFTEAEKATATAVRNMLERIGGSSLETDLIKACSLTEDANKLVRKAGPGASKTPLDGATKMRQAADLRGEAKALMIKMKMTVMRAYSNETMSAQDRPKSLALIEVLQRKQDELEQGMSEDRLTAEDYESIGHVALGQVNTNANGRDPKLIRDRYKSICHSLPSRYCRTRLCFLAEKHSSLCFSRQ